MYSGQTASYSYKLLKDNKKNLKRIFILGPDHKIGFKGIGISPCSKLKTPLGQLEVDLEVLAEIKKKLENEKRGLFYLCKDDDESEHSLEMQYPFLKDCLGEGFKIVPLMIGDLENDDDLFFSEILKEFFLDQENLFVFSTDFCHWGDFYCFKPHDGSTPIYKFIEKLDFQGIDLLLKKNSEGFKKYLEVTQNNICGKNPLKIMNKLIEGTEFSIKELKYDQSSRVLSEDDFSVSYYSAYIS